MRQTTLGAAALLCALFAARSAWAQAEAKAPDTAQPETPLQPVVPAPPQPVVAPPGWLLPHWDKGFVLVASPEPRVPFRLVLNHVSQFKYTNSMATNPTYTDHFGDAHDVLRRNDIQLTRDVFYFSGYAF